MGKPIVISVLGDTRDLVRGLDGGESRLSKFGKVAKVGLLGVGAGLALATGAAFKLAQAAAEDQQSAALMAKQFRNSAKATDAQIASTEKWITKQGLAKGVADDQLRPALSNLIRSTHDVGKAQGLANLAMDISAQTGKDLGAVSLALARAQNGNVSALSRLGIQTKDATGKTLTFKQVHKQLTDQFGGAATTKAKTFAGMIDRVKLFVSETGEAIGYKLLPPLTEAGTWLITTGVPAVSKFGGELSRRLSPAVAAVKGTLTAIVPIFGQVGDVISTKVLPILSSAGAFLTQQLIPAVIGVYTQVGTKLKPVFDALADTFRVNILPTVDKVLVKFHEWQPTIEATILTVAKITGKILVFAATILGKVLPPLIRLTGFLIGKVVPAIFTVIGWAIKITAKVISFGAAIITAGEKAGRFASTIISKIAGLPKAIGDVTGKLLSIGRDLIGGLIQGIKDKAGDLVGAIKSFVIDKIPGPVAKALGIKSPSRVFRGFGQNIVQGLVGGIESERGSVTRIMDRLASDVSTFSATIPTPTIRPTFDADARSAGTRGGVTFAITLEVPVGATGADVGRELVSYIGDYYSAGGQRL